MRMYGANTDDLREVARDFGNAGRVTEDAQASTSHAMGDLEWVGKDAELFRERYAEPIPRLLAQLALDLDDHSRDLYRQANEQDDASAAKGRSLAAAALGASLLTGLEGAMGALVGGLGGRRAAREASELVAQHTRDRALALAQAAFAEGGMAGIATLANILAGYALLFGPASLIGRGALGLLAALGQLMQRPTEDVARVHPSTAPKMLEFITPEEQGENRFAEPKKESSRGGDSSGGGGSGGGSVPSEWSGGSSASGHAPKLPAPGAGLMTSLAAGGMGGSGRALGDGVSAFGGSIAGFGQQMPPLLFAIGGLGLAGAAAGAGVVAAKAFKRNQSATSAR